MPKIALATVLKAIDDVRNFEKLGLFFAKQSPDNQVHIIGFDNGNLPQAFSRTQTEGAANSIFFHPLFRFSRHSLRRLGAGFGLLRWLMHYRPQTVLIGAVELLWVGFLYKIGYNCWVCCFFQNPKQKALLLYDLRENYYRNIRYQNVYPAFLKKGLSAAVRLYERFCTLFYDKILVAERCYVFEIDFLSKRKYEIIENKFKPTAFLSDQTSEKNKEKEKNEWLLTGTFTEAYGTLQGILFFEKLCHFFPSPSLRLRIIGYAPSAAYRQKIKLAIENSCEAARIEAQILAEPLPPLQIWQAMQRAEYLLLPYLPNASTENCIPTKLYEGLFFKNKILLQNNIFWKSQFGTLPACFFTNFTALDSNLFSDAAFLTWQKEIPAQITPLEAILWQGEADKLARFLRH